VEVTGDRTERTQGDVRSRVLLGDPPPGGKKEGGGQSAKEEEFTSHPMIKEKSNLECKTYEGKRKRANRLASGRGLRWAKKKNKLRSKG